MYEKMLTYRRSIHSLLIFLMVTWRRGKKNVLVGFLAEQDFSKPRNGLRHLIGIELTAAEVSIVEISD